MYVALQQITKQQFTMKKLLFILMLLLSANTLIVNAAEAKKEEIPLKKGNSEDYDKNTPRTQIPFVCYYEDGFVSLEIWSNVGLTQLSVANQTTGEQWSVVNSLSLNVSTASGTYIVQILTEDGSIYYGTYSI